MSWFYCYQIVLLVLFAYLNTSYVLVLRARDTIMVFTELTYLNTSYVLVLLSKQLSENGKVVSFKYILCLGSTRRYLNVKIQGKRFKYILCLGSTGHIWFLSQSYPVHLNTSYVLVLLLYGAIVQHLLGNLNTSYVLVLLIGGIEMDNLKRFKYILCLGSTN